MKVCIKFITKKSINLILSLLFVLISFFVSSCSGDLQKCKESKELKITFLGFNTTINNYFIPGSDVELLARSNKNDVDYLWDVPGEWKEIKKNKIVWKVPEQEGDYKLSVSVKDKTTNQTDQKSVNVTVADNVICAVPETVSYKVITKTTFNNKLIGKDVQQTVSSITMNSDDTVYVETIESSGEVSKTYVDSEAVYSIDKNGNREIVGKRSSEDSYIPKVNILGLASLKNACSTYESDGRFYTFRQSSSSQRAEVEYDSKIGMVTRIKSENDENMEVSDIQMDYEVIDGYIIPSKVSGLVTYYVAGEKYTVQIEQKISDVKINSNGEE